MTLCRLPADMTPRPWRDARDMDKQRTRLCQSLDSILFQGKQNMMDGIAVPHQRRPVGITKGPGETIHQYTFVSQDSEQVLKNGEYVYYELETGRESSAHLAGNTSSRKVLGRILKRMPVQQYPDTFLAEPEIAPAEVARLVGYDSRATELFEIHVGIMGYYDEQLGSFVNPWIPPRSGRPIFLAEDDLLAHVLSKKRMGDIGSAHIGSLLTRQPEAVPVVLDLKELVSTHLAIIASTGAGKSYLASVLIEELMRPQNKACVLIVDPHGEYHTLTHIMNVSAFSSSGQRYRPKVIVYKPEQVKVKMATLSLGDLRYLLPELSEKQHFVLGRAYNRVSHHARGRWTLDDLISAVQGAGRDEGDEGKEDSSTVRALQWRLESRFRDSFTFHDSQHLDLKEIFRPGQCAILQLNEIDERDQQVIVATILRRLYHARMDTDRGKVHERDERYLPYPAFVLLEEAHHFAPAGADLVSSQILKQVLAEGRKFGIGIGLISQRPGKLDPDVLSQCLTQCIMRIVNEIDQKSVAAAIEGVGRDLLGNLPALSKGQVIVAGSAVNTPVLCRVRPRITPHGGESKDAPAIWQEYLSESAVAARERDVAPLARPPASFSPFGDEDD
jgi:DNA helicase HerA-like ATPase